VASFHQTTGIEFRELNAEANLAYCEAIISYNPNKGSKLSTWVYICVKNALLRFIAEEKKQQVTTSIEFYLTEEDNDSGYIPDALLTTDPEPWQTMEQEFRGLARKVVDVVLDTDNFEGSSKAMRGQVVEELRLQGWSWPTIWNGVREVKMVLNN
jgi:DNA-directed RNA polymerase specialized sigma24 family protein